MRVHLIAIGGSAMHNLALALQEKGYEVSGSDDEVFEPSRSRLAARGLLPSEMGWNPSRIGPHLDAVILGMHARQDNPELIRAMELGLKIYSYPEYLYAQNANRKRVVIGGSHGKTTITSMIMHVLRHAGIDFNYLVGAQLEGFDTMVRLSDSASVAVFEGDEYLASPIDRRPKFHLYHPHIAVVSGIAWDHINVFPTFSLYVEQFEKFMQLIESGGTLIYSADDATLSDCVNRLSLSIETVPYQPFPSVILQHITHILRDGESVPLKIFGAHNMQNLRAAYEVCIRLGVDDTLFFDAMRSFRGAARRLQTLAETEQSTVFLDFAHSPSKLGATLKAVTAQYPGRQLVACMELHTFSSLNSHFLQEYRHTMQGADKAFVYYNPHTLEHKKLPPISAEAVREAFGDPFPEVYTDSKALIARLESMHWDETNALLMTSGNFDGVDMPELALRLVRKQL